MQRNAKPRRGRPTNSGWDESTAIAAIEELLAADPSLSTRKAIIQVVGDSPSDIRRLQRKLKTKQSGGMASVMARMNRAIESHSIIDLRSIMDELGIDRRLDRDEITTQESIEKYIDDHRLAGVHIELNAHDTRFDHGTNVTLHRDAKGLIRYSSMTGDMEILSPPEEDDLLTRAGHVVWERTSAAVVLSPEEKQAWDATDGAHWRLMNDWSTPYWRKLLPLWRRPDLSMTTALRRIAYAHGWESLKNRDGQVDLMGILSYEERSPVPASRTTSLPERIRNALTLKARIAWWHMRHPHLRILPSISNGNMLLPDGNTLHMRGTSGGVHLDSVGNRSTDIRLWFDHCRSGLEDVYRVRFDEETRFENDRGEPASTEEVVDTIMLIEHALDDLASRRRRISRAIKTACRAGLLLATGFVVLGLINVGIASRVDTSTTPQVLRPPIVTSESQAPAAHNY